MTPSELKDYALANYVSEDGLGRLDIYDSRPGHFPSEEETVFFDNGPLVMVTLYYFFGCFGLLDGEDKKRFVKMMWALRYAPGIYLRNPNRRGPLGEIELRNSKDNYDAMWIGCTLFNEDEFLLDIVGNYNPHTFLTPKETGVYKLSLNIPQNIIEWMMVIGGFIVSALQPSSRSSEGILNFLTIEALKMRMPFKVKSLWLLPLYASMWFWNVMIHARFGSPLVFFETWYQDKQHPCLLFARLKWDESLPCSSPSEGSSTPQV